MSVYRLGRSVPEFVKRLRERRSLTQGDLAEELKVHIQYVSNVERGIRSNFSGLCVKLIPKLPKAQGEHLFSLLVEDYVDHLSEKIKFKEAK